MTEVCFPTDACMVKIKGEHPLNQEEGEEDMSGTQFVCETVIRSLTLDAAPDHKPPQKKKVMKSEYCLCCLLWLSVALLSLHSDIGHKLLCTAGGDIFLIVFLDYCIDSLQTLQDTFTCNVLSEESPRIKTNAASKKESKICQSEAMTENGSGK